MNCFVSIRIIVMGELLAAFISIVRWLENQRLLYIIFMIYLNLSIIKHTKKLEALPKDSSVTRDQIASSLYLPVMQETLKINCVFPKIVESQNGYRILTA